MSTPDEFETPLTADETVEQLWLACAMWAGLAASFQRLADAGHDPTSRARRDTDAAAVAEPPPVLSHYTRERAWNAARMLQALHRRVFDTEPGRLHLDATVMYPLMRAALEDAATIVWLQAPDSRDERILRTLRVLHTDALYFEDNHARLYRVASDQGVAPTQDLDAHVETQKRERSAHFALLAKRSGLDEGEVTRKLWTSTPIAVVYGQESTVEVMWKMLSDLSHFSYLMLRHLATSPVPGSDAQLLHVTVLQFANTLNTVCADALRALEVAAGPDPAAQSTDDPQPE